MEKKSRAEYFRKRREAKGQFMAMIDKDMLSKLNEALRKKGVSRVSWLKEQIARELEGK